MKSAVKTAARMTRMRLNIFVSLKKDTRLDKPPDQLGRRKTGFPSPALCQGSHRVKHGAPRGYFRSDTPGCTGYQRVVGAPYFCLIRNGFTQDLRATPGLQDRPRPEAHTEPHKNDALILSWVADEVAGRWAATRQLTRCRGRWRRCVLSFRPFHGQVIPARVDAPCRSS